MNKYKAIILCHGTWGKVLVEEANKNFGLVNQYEVFSLSPEKEISVFMIEFE